MSDIAKVLVAFLIVSNVCLSGCSSRIRLRTEWDTCSKCGYATLGQQYCPIDGNKLEKRYYGKCECGYEFLPADIKFKGYCTNCGRKVK